LQVINPLAAGVDVGSEEMHVSIAGGAPKVFGTTTGQLNELRDYLVEHGVPTVAMEATGVYWFNLYEVLEKAGLEVVMVNGKYVRNVPGRKSDVSDCQWLATLHAHGLLKGGFVPPEHVRRLQDYVRQRNDHIMLAGSHEQHMQEALERMNVKIHDVISDLTGYSGLRMVGAILGGERDPEKLVDLCDEQIRNKKRGRLIEALQGNWKTEHLFALRQAHELWEVYQQKILECDKAMEVELQAMAGPEDPNNPAPPAKKLGGINTPKIANLHAMLWRICGCKDPTQLPGIASHALLQVVAEVGTDLQKYWKTEHQFTAWLALAPGSHQSGKRWRNQPRGRRNRAGRLFCVIARSVGRSVDKALGGFYRRLKGRRGGLIANVALARKIAQLFWRLMVRGTQYVEKGLKQYEEQIAESERRLLQKLARKYKFQLHPNAP
jgi:transposase